MGDKALELATGAASTGEVVEPHWYACYTRGRAEKKVGDLLPRLGIETYLPLVPRERQWADRVKHVEWPLFPSYVFARFALDEVGRVLRTPGVATVVRLGGEYVPIEDSEIANIRRFAEALSECGHDAAQPATYIAVGERVRVIEGPFEGVEGLVVRRRRRDRLLVGLGAIRQGFEVDVPAAHLRVLP
ncbi:MAG: transcription termination/antitermination protein NusG [Longimicrobiales bacterium]